MNNDPIRITNAEARADVSAAASGAWERAGDRRLPFPNEPSVDVASVIEELIEDMSICWPKEYAIVPKERFALWLAKIESLRS